VVYFFMKDNLGRLQKVDLREIWEKELKEENRPLIGINWQGNKTIERMPIHQGRSIPLENFSIIADINKGKLISLQKGPDSIDARNCSFKSSFVSCQSKIDSVLDFNEVSAIASCCDLIITSDTYLAHLTGSVGLKTFLVLKFVPEWRWGLESEWTSWYPSVKLFRQERRGEWQEVMSRIKKEILNIL